MGTISPIPDVESHTWTYVENGGIARLLTPRQSHERHHRPTTKRDYESDKDKIRHHQIIYGSPRGYRY